MRRLIKPHPLGCNMLEKECIICGKLFPKDKRVSMKIWETQTRFCSQQCVSKDKTILANRKKGIIQSYKDGRQIWNKGKELHYEVWNKGKGDYAKKLGFGKWMTGKKLSIETREKMSKAQRGENGTNWQGGITKINNTIRRSLQYRLWREAVFRRDDWTCQACGVKSGQGKKVILHADHIKPFAYYPELRFEITNGRTLCRSCHAKTDTYKGKALTYNKN